MLDLAFTPADLAQLDARGITPGAIAAQLQRLRHPPRPIVLDRPCTVGDGIIRLTPDQRRRLIEHGDAAIARGRVTKFVPASGAATRMFKDLIAAWQAEPRPSSVPAAREFFERLDDFPFSPELHRRAGVPGQPATEAEERTMLRVLLEDMHFADLPKGLVPFHRGDTVRTAFEEHLLEGIRYSCGDDGVCRLHFTVGPEARAEFERALARIGPVVEAERPGCRLAVAFSEQLPSTDTVAIDLSGEPFRNADGTLLFRPSGHGALLRNLQQLNGDLVVIKNIDNVVPAAANGEVVEWKRTLIGCAAELQAAVHGYLEALSSETCGDETIDAALGFAQRRFARGSAASGADRTARRESAIHALDRPLRVCGVVPNEGEPGGAPFWVDSAGECTVQIVEPSQVDTRDGEQAQIFRSATHFNPVDIVCAMKSWRGEPYDLERFVDEETAFVVSKSADGRELIALERPGLWNGAMAGWNTVCVEVPASTFAPVKTVLDLLRPEHQPRRERG